MEVKVRSRKIKRGSREVEEFAFFDEREQRLSEWFQSIWPREGEFCIVEWKMKEALFHQGKRISRWYDRIGRCGAVLGESDLYLAVRIGLHSQAKMSIFGLKGKRLTPWLSWKEWYRNFSESIYASLNFRSKLLDLKSEKDEVVRARRALVERAFERRLAARLLLELYRRDESIIKIKRFEDALKVSEIATAVIEKIQPKKKKRAL